MIGEKTSESVISAYQPSKEVIEATKCAQECYERGFDILHTPYQELNGYSVIERMNKDQKTFQSFVDESQENPEEAWKWIGTRSLARKKAFAMHAHLTSNYIIPNVFPQNGAQEDDRAMANVMRDILEWETLNSNYRPSFLLATMGMLVNPVTYMQADYLEVYQTIKERNDEGYGEKEVLDSVLSGLVCRVMSADQVLISNLHEQDIQKQCSIIKRRYVDKSELKAKYGDHENWDYLQSGVNVVFDSESGLFYDIKDDDHEDLCEEVTYENRREDTEICFVGGIYFGEENVDWNPIRHRDNRNAPKYDVVPFGYHRVNEHFFYYASMMNEVGWDDKLIDAMYQTTMNREFLDLEQPIVASGFDKLDSSVIFPGGIYASANPDARITPILPPRATNPYIAIQAIEDSMSEGTLSETQQGMTAPGSQTAYEVNKTQQNANIVLSGVRKTMAESVSQIGALLVDIALQHLTTAQVDELTGDLKYREFVLEDQMIGGKKMSKKIRFDEALMGRRMDKHQKKEYAMKLLEEVNYPDNKQSLSVVNPGLFSKMSYLVRMEAEDMQPKDTQFERVMAERLYTLLRADPLIKPEALIRELLYAVRPQSVDALIVEQDQQQQMAGSIMGQQQPIPGLPSNALSGV